MFFSLYGAGVPPGRALCSAANTPELFEFSSVELQTFLTGSFLYINNFFSFFMLLTCSVISTFFLNENEMK